MEVTQKTIDIEKILRAKMGTKAKWVPAFAINWLKRIAHEDQCNQFLWDARDLKGTPWLESCLKFLDTRLDVQGLENLPPKDDGRLYTFVSNHPMGGIDGVALGSIIGRHYDDRFRYLVNDLADGRVPRRKRLCRCGRQHVQPDARHTLQEFAIHARFAANEGQLPSALPRLSDVYDMESQKSKVESRKP